MFNVHKNLQNSIISIIRPLATTANKLNSLQPYKNEPVKLIAIPITKNKTYIYFKHLDHFINRRSKLIQLEQNVVAKCSTLWEKMKKSPKRINTKIVTFINQYMNQIPWQEESLRSIPGEHYIMKRIKVGKSGELKARPIIKMVTTRQYKKANPLPEAIPIAVYYPTKIIEKSRLILQLNELSKWGLRYHLKEIYKCLILLPLTIPLALIPIVPNIPGFYLLYRIYCNIKAYLGAKHLQQILKDDLLDFRELQDYNMIFSVSPTLTETKINQITRLLEVDEINSHLKKSLLQEEKTFDGD
ncbi:Mrx19p PWA37_004302 [Arxiozyma heterogenica]